VYPSNSYLGHDNLSRLCAPSRALESGSVSAMAHWYPCSVQLALKECSPTLVTRIIDTESTKLHVDSTCLMCFNARARFFQLLMHACLFHKSRREIWPPSTAQCSVLAQTTCMQLVMHHRGKRTQSQYNEHRFRGDVWKKFTCEHHGNGSEEDINSFTTSRSACGTFGAGCFLFVVSS